MGRARSWLDSISCVSFHSYMNCTVTQQPDSA